MRGAAPLMTMLATALLIGARVSAVGMVAVAALSLGVFLMSLRGGRVGGFERRAELSPCSQLLPPAATHWPMA